MEINKKELTEMINVLAKEIVVASKKTFTEYNRTFISVIQRVREKNMYDVIDEYNIVRTIPMSIPNILLSVGQRVYVTVPNGDFTKMYISGVYLQTNRGEPNSGSSTITPSQIGTLTATQINNLVAQKANIFHASATTDYGISTPNLYGHTKVVNNLNQSSHADGNALSAYQGYVLSSKIDDEINGVKGLVNDLNVSSPSSDGNDISFIDTISQNKGLITATKKTIQKANSSQLGVIMPDNETVETDNNGVLSLKSITDRTSRLSTDFVDDTDILASSNSSSGFDGVSIVYRRKALYIWNYIKSKISSVCTKIFISTNESYEKATVNSILSASYKNEDGTNTLIANGIISLIGTDKTTNSNPSVSFGSNGTTIIHGGECGSTFSEENNIYDDKNLYIIADENICFYPNCEADSSGNYPVILSEGSFGGANCNYYGTCDTADNIADKEVTVTNPFFKLVIGAFVGIKFDYTNTSADITLNVNNTGAISIYENGAVVTNGDGGCIADHVNFYMYNGTYWCKQ